MPEGLDRENLPSWLAVPAAELELTRDPRARYHRLRDWFQAYVELTSLAMLTVLAHTQELASDRNLARALQPLLQKSMGISDWVSLHALLQNRLPPEGLPWPAVNASKQVPDAFGRAAERLRPGSGAGGLRLLLEILASEAEPWDREAGGLDLGALLLELEAAATEAVRCTPFLSEYGWSYVEGVTLKPNGQTELFVHDLMGAGWPRARAFPFEGAPPMGLYLRSGREFRVPVPHWLATYDLGARRLSFFRGVQRDRIALHSRVMPGGAPAGAPADQLTALFPVEPVISKVAEVPEVRPPGEEPVLLLLEGPVPFEVIPLRRAQVAGGLVLGRDPGTNGLPLVDATVSRQHARIQVVGAAVEVYDLGSRNGVIVNGSTSEEGMSLSPGDQIRIGNFLFELVWMSELDVLHWTKVHEFTRLSGHDPISGLPASRELPNLLRDATRREGAPVAGVLRIDHLEGIRAKHGDAAAEEVLRAAAREVLRVAPEFSKSVRLTSAVATIAADATTLEKALRRARLELSGRTWDQAAGLSVSATPLLVPYHPEFGVDAWIEDVRAAATR